MAERNNYKASTEGLLGKSPGNIQSSLPSLSDLGSYKVATDAIRLAEAAVQTGLKLTLSEAGVWKQIIRYNFKAKTEGLSREIPINDSERNDKYTADTGTIISTDYEGNINSSRSNYERQAVFRAGNFFLPLSFSYDLKAGKQYSTSQLVDGPEIIQQVYKRPKEVTVRIKVERDNARLADISTASNMAFLEATTVMSQGDDLDDPQIQNESNQPNLDLIGLGVVLNELYETNDVFQVENRVLNNDYMVDWVYLTGYDISTEVGSSITTLTLNMRSIDINENAIIFNF